MGVAVMSVKKVLSVVMTAVTAFALSGCFLFGPTKLSTTLTTELSKSTVKSVTFFMMDSQSDVGYIAEELPAGQLDEFLNEVNSYQLVKHAGHTDYFWGGQFGIEFKLEDGTYLRYDGTELEHSRVSFDADPDNGDLIKDEFIECEDVVFWDEMCKYFSAVNANRTHLKSGY